MKEFKILIIDCNTRHYRDISLLMANYLKNFSVKISPPTEKLFEEFRSGIYIVNKSHQTYPDMERTQNNIQKIVQVKYDLVVLAREIFGDQRDHDEITGFDFFKKFIHDTTVPILGIYPDTNFKCSECEILDDNFRKNLLTLKNPVGFINERFISLQGHGLMIYHENNPVDSFSYTGQHYLKPVLEKLLSLELDPLPEKR